MERKEIVFYDNNFTSEAEALAIEFLAEQDEPITDEAVFYQMYLNAERDYDDFRCAINTYFRKERPTLIFNGIVGLWHGNYGGCKIVENVDSWDKIIATDIFKSCDYFKFWQDERGTLILEATHHDGHNHFSVYQLSEQGAEMNYAWEHGTAYDELSFEQLHQELLTNHIQQINLSNYYYEH